jgi:predicted PurR-regulated permease PerM
MNTQRGFLLFLVTALLFIAGLMLKPFLGYLLGAVILAFILMPLQDKLSKHTGGSISALSLIILVLMASTVPFAVVISAVAGDARDVAGEIGENRFIDLEEIEEEILDYTGQEVNLESEIRQAINRFVSLTIGSLSGLLNIMSKIAVGFSVMMFALYYLLKDGRDFQTYVKNTLPLPEDITNRLAAKTRKTTWAVIKGHILVAIAQGLIAGLGLWLTGVPNFAFWTFAMILLSFIPIIGAFLVWGPAAIYLALIGRPMAGAVLFLYGSIVVGMTDNFLRPILVDKSAELHPAVILIGVIGGVYVFGAVGLFIGPVIFGILKAVLEVFKKNYETL